MNMHGFLPAAAETDGYDDEPTWRDRARDRLVALRPLLLIVFLPTLLLAFYYYAIASDQYESEAHFIVDAKDSSGPSAGGIGAMLGISTTGNQSQLLSVPDYLKSHDAVDALARQIDLPTIFSRPGVDPLSRMWKKDPTPEELLRYYKGKVSVHFDRDTGITELTVRSFRPEDSYQIITRLLKLSERRINEMNLRSYNDAVAMSRQQVREAERNIADVQGRMTAYRRSGRDVDPKASGEAQIQLVTQLTSSLAGARAQLQTMGAMIDRSSPQYRAAARQVASLERELARQSSKLTGGTSDIATNLGGYEDLQVRQQFAAKQYDAAAASLEKAREDAMRQQLYLVRVVDANVPVKSLYPQRGKIVLTVFLALLVAYGIGWLIVAGVREHAA